MKINFKKILGWIKFVLFMIPFLAFWVWVEKPINFFHFMGLMALIVFPCFILFAIGFVAREFYMWLKTLFKRAKDKGGAK